MPLVRPVSVNEVPVSPVWKGVVPSPPRAFPVVSEGQLVGVVGLAELRRIPRPLWPVTRVSEVMSRELDHKRGAFSLSGAGCCNASLMHLHQLSRDCQAQAQSAEAMGGLNHEQELVFGAVSGGGGALLVLIAQIKRVE